MNSTVGSAQRFESSRIEANFGNDDRDIRLMVRILMMASPLLLSRCARSGLIPFVAISLMMFSFGLYELNIP